MWDHHPSCWKNLCAGNSRINEKFDSGLVPENRINISRPIKGHFCIIFIFKPCRRACSNNKIVNEQQSTFFYNYSPNNIWQKYTFFCFLFHCILFYFLHLITSVDDIIFEAFGAVNNEQLWNYFMLTAYRFDSIQL